MAAKPVNGWRWAAAGAVVGVIAALVAYAPAHWLAAALRSASDDHLRLLDTRGTIWNGSAAVVLASGVDGTEAVALPGRAGWQLRPRWGSLDVALELPCCAAQTIGFLAAPTGEGVRLVWRDGRSVWPATMLAGLGAPWNTLRLEGRLALQTQSFITQWQGAQLRLTGRATLDAEGMSSRLYTLKPLGSYRLALEGESAASLLLTTQADSSLLLEGSGRWTGTALHFSGAASAAAGREEVLSNLLNIVGRREGARSIITLG
ncbi:MAG: type II secretion system protein N [Zoogloeaceae bacterium]|jgi:general secretion pathway protein N|nr:type II secretion system protein N [Zoogloeaceae bacterium]